MNCKNLKNLVIFILLGISSISIARDNKSACAVEENQIIQVSPSTDKYTKVYELANPELIIIREFYANDGEKFKIKLLQKAIAKPRKILERPLEVIGILEYKGTSGKAEHIEELEQYTIFNQ